MEGSVLWMEVNGDQVLKRKEASILYSRLLLVFLFLLSVVRVVFASVTELSPDEAYYWVWSLHLDAGYYDHPPMVAILIRMGTILFGTCELGVRIGAIFCGFLIAWMMYHNVRLLTGNAPLGFWAAVLVSVTPILAVGSVVHTPDAALGAAWSLAVWFGLRILRSDRFLDWMGLGVSVGLSCLSKGTGFLLLPGLLLFALLHPWGRQRLFGVKAIVMVLAAGMVVSPNILWNLSHGGGSLAFQVAHAFFHPRIEPFGWLEFVLGQAFVVSPLLFLGLVVFVVVGWKRRTPLSERGAFLLWCLSGPWLVGALLLSAVHKLEANWPAVFYLAAMPGMVWMVAEQRWRMGHLKRWVGAAGGVACLLTLAIHIQVLVPFLPLPARADATARLRGWKELAREASSRADAEGATLAAEGYATVSELMFYTGRDVLYQASPARMSQFDLRLQEAPNRVLLLQSKTTQDILPLCVDRNRRWHADPANRESLQRRMSDYQWWICEGDGVGRDTSP
jgi:4-amino-4-deoxy-L-arabinose transferase-like glycosyltransferase